jgi:hypothetical protein
MSVNGTFEERPLAFLNLPDHGGVDEQFLRLSAQLTSTYWASQVAARGTRSQRSISLSV